MNITKNGAEIIQKMIDEAKANGTNKVVIEGGRYEIEKAILIPSDFYLVLDNCYLRMADNTFCNMFNNQNCHTEIGGTVEGTDRNIVIEGKGNVIIDGGEYNGLSEKNYSKDGNPHITVNNILLFRNVDGFRISGLHIRNQRYWALNFYYCRNGRINNIDFLSDYTNIDENGVRTPYLTLENYDNVYIKNSDGIDLRVGCHDIIIENITGFTEDDTVALTGVSKGDDHKLFNQVEGLSSDMYNIIIRNIQSSAYWSNVRLLAQGGIKMYNILVDGIVDTSQDSKYMLRGASAIRIGDFRMYGYRQPTEDEFYNITVRNVYSRAEHVIRLAGVMGKCVFDNINGYGDYEKFIENKATVDVEKFFR